MSSVTRTRNETTGGTRRPRCVAAALVAALLLLPTSCGDDATDAGDQPPTPTTSSPSGSASPTAPAPDASPDDLLAGLTDGEPPAVPYVDRRTLVRPDGTTVRLPAVYDQLVLVGDLLLGTRGDDRGNRVLDEVDASGRRLVSHRIESSVVVDATGTVAAWATPQGEVVVRTADGTASWGNQGGPVSVAAVVGEAPCTGDDCRVWTSNLEVPPGWVDADGDVGRVAAQALRVEDVHPSGLAALQLTSSDTGSCSGVEELAGGELLWRTCDHTLSRFSPDGALVLASEPYLDGLGRAEVSMLDARTGKPLVSYRVQQAFIAQTVWEDETHALVVVLGPDGWVVVRIGSDGSRDLAAGPFEPTLDATFQVVAVAGNR